MAVKFVDDVVAPIVVMAVDLTTETVAPKWNSWANYGMTIVGYAGALGYLGRMGSSDFVKNVGIASAPGSARRLYELVRGKMGIKAMPNRVSRYPAPIETPQFRGVRLS